MFFTLYAKETVLILSESPIFCAYFIKNPQNFGVELKGVDQKSALILLEEVFDFDAQGKIVWRPLNGKNETQQDALLKNTLKADASLNNVKLLFFMRRLNKMDVKDLIEALSKNKNQFTQNEHQQIYQALVQKLQENLDIQQWTNIKNQLIYYANGHCYPHYF